MTTTLWVEPALCAVSGGLRYNRQLRQALRDKGMQTYVLSLPTESFDGAEGAAAIYEQRQRLKPDLVILDGLIGSAHPELFQPAGAGEPAPADVLLVHLPQAAAMEAQGIADPEVVAAEEASVCGASQVVAVSRWGASELRRRYRRQDVHVAVPGVEVSGVEVPASPAIRSESQEGITFVCVAGLNPLKNHRLLISALEPLRDRSWRLVLAGPGAETDYGRQLLLDMDERLPGRVDYRGVLEPDRVAALWAEADLLLLPSLIETYGMVVTEACAHGVPSLVSAGTGAEEALAGAGEALAATPSRWTAALKNYLTDAAVRSQLSEATRHRRDELPTWSAAAEIFARLEQPGSGSSDAPIG